MARRSVFALVALALVLFSSVAPAGAGAGADTRFPDLSDCPEVVVGEGNKLVLHAFGVGVQIYRWNGTGWDFVAPEAVLYANPEDDGPVAIHFAGPTWQSASGSKVVGTADGRCTPDPDSIPWLRLKAASTEGPGLFDGVSYVQRLFTVGGNAPAEPGDFVGQIARVPYTADYLFYYPVGQ